MDFQLKLTAEQFEFLSSLLVGIVPLYENQAAALALLEGEAARDLAQEKLDASQNAAEIAWLLAQCEGGERNGETC